MDLQFFKYQATGNDFIIIDGREQPVTNDIAFIKAICDRRFGVGSDGFIIIKPHKKFDFEVDFYNPDGSQSLCGNGTRAAIKFAKSKDFFQGDHIHFTAFDGEHEAWLLPDGRVKLKMSDVHSVRLMMDGTFVDTGSPHLVRWVEKLDEFDVYKEGRELRYSSPFEKGLNVNFIERISEEEIKIRTYERGVENETLSCGTGVTAAAIVAAGNSPNKKIKIYARGGELEVELSRDESGKYKNIMLIGPAEEVFSGLYSMDK